MDFFKIKNKTDTSADLYFYGDIVSDSWQSYWTEEDRCPEDIREFLNDIEDHVDLNIYVNSGGGSVFGGLAIYNMLKRHKGYKTVYVDGIAASIASVIALAGDRVIVPSNAFIMIHKPSGNMLKRHKGYKTVYVDGIAASIASVIALAGDRVIVPSNAFIMIHKPSGVCFGNSDEMREYAEVLDKTQTNLMNVYKENLCEGVDLSEIEEMVNNETWLNGEEASKYFKIEVAGANETVACVSEWYKKYTKIPGDITNEVLMRNQQKLEEEKNKLLLELELI